MGQYNPYAPRIIGQEWVPIRPETLRFSGEARTFEQGHSFSLSAPTRITEGRLYLDNLNTPSRGVVPLIAIYPKGREAQSGPVMREVIPLKSVALTGGTPTSGFTALECLLNPNDQRLVTFDETQSLVGLIAQFRVAQYPNLADKRILKVNLLGQGSGSDDVFGAGSSSPTIYFLVDNPATLTTANPQAFIGRVGDGNPVIYTNSIGEINPLWQSASTPQSPFQTARRMPWSYRQLRRLDDISNLLYILFATGTSLGASATHSLCSLSYMALEVFYCEETRVAFGANMNGGSNFVALSTPWVDNTNIIQMGDVATYYASSSGFTFNTDPVLAAGDYTVTVTAADTGDDLDTGTDPTPPVSALREIYAMPAQPGVRVNSPFPMDANALGETFTKEQVHVLPQLSLNTSGGPVNAVHVYGAQARAQVYGGVTATQWTLDSNTGTPASYPWVRYYARRFGDTTVPLTLSAVVISGGVPTATITPSAFDRLEPIIDGWKEITLPVSGALTMNVGVNRQWRWSATGETAGNRWEVLGAVAPAVSGQPSGLYIKVPSPQQLSAATYGQPTAGASINMAWMPGYSPPSASTADDETADAVLMFSQEPVAVSGFAVQQLNLPLSGIGLNCGIAPQFVPTAMGYNKLTWLLQAASLEASYGYLEIQRMDTITDWATIAKITNPRLLIFNDYEARVDILTSYRSRYVNIYGFVGPWSSTITSTIPAPGVTATGLTANDHVMIFSTNSTQSGARNLAYSPGWEGEVTEDFSFPEASGQVYQTMYDRDYVVAFRPLERGGTNFARTLLVQAAAISPETLEDFTSLRDMAWADVPYICVRDEDGNRWFTNVAVPSGAVQRSRRLYLAPVSIVEVTNTPTPVNPT